MIGWLMILVYHSEVQKRTTCFLDDSLRLAPCAFERCRKYDRICKLNCSVAGSHSLHFPKVARQFPAILQIPCGKTAKIATPRMHSYNFSDITVKDGNN